MLYLSTSLQLQMLIQLQESKLGQIRLNGDLSKPIAITISVKQDCVLTPTLLSIFCSMVVKQVTDDLDDENLVYVGYQMDGSLFNLRRLQIHTKTKERLSRILLFVDDAALVAQTGQTLQRITSCFSDTLQLFGLDVSLRKTEVPHLPVPKKNSDHPRHHWQFRTEINTIVYLPGLHHRI